ncbi:MAG: inositol monophosphatase [Planctomycetes bacterium]|nr:inositol monophosphatase [Planctomycetota bacterium]
MNRGDALRPFVVAAEELARAAGTLLLQFRVRPELRAESKGRRRELVTQADREAERIIVGGLQARFPGHGVLAEEGVLTQAGVASTSSEWLWIVDPLDGTTNFVHGLPNFAVSIALAHRGVPVVGVVHAPALGDTWVAAAGLGAFRNGAAVSVSATGEVADALLATGFSYNRNEPGRDDNSQRLARVLPQCRDLRRFGSAALDLCMVGGGLFDGYWELYLAPYDVAAGAVVVQQAGGVVSDLRGGADWLHGGSIVAANASLHTALRLALQ